MRIHLLGYSESTISRILDSLLLHDYSEEVIIVQNTGVEETSPFCPPGIAFKKIKHEQWRFDPATHSCLLGVTKPVVKKIVFDFFLNNSNVQQQNYISLFHPSAVISSTVKLGNASFIEPGTVIASFAILGFGVFINRGVTIGHHVILNDFVTVNPGVHIAGHCNIGKGTQIGMGCSVFDHVNIGSNTVIGGGSIVTKDIPDNVIAWGNPCRIIRKNGKN